MLNKQYLAKTVYEAAVERVALIFDRFLDVYVSVSSGKDSTVLYHLCRQEAERRGRQVNVFFLDQEAEYQASIDLMREMMRHPSVVPHWYQVPIWMTNATSYAQDRLYAWGEGEPWIRDKEPDSIHAIEGKYPRRFYPFFEWFEKTRPGGTAFLVGLRAEEGIKRFRAVTSHPGHDGIKWSTRTRHPDSFKFYPLYDWGMGDVWKFIADGGHAYNRIYDKMWALNHGVYNTMRVSNLIHEKSFRCVAELPALEPDTYAKLVKRVPGIHCAAHHARGAFLYDAKTLPERFATWRAFRDHILETMPIADTKKERFRQRFATQGDEEPVCQAQCKRLLINDWENSVPITTPSKTAKPVDRFARWRKLF